MVEQRGVYDTYKPLFGAKEGKTYKTCLPLTPPTQPWPN